MVPRGVMVGMKFRRTPYSLNEIVIAPPTPPSAQHDLTSQRKCSSGAAEDSRDGVERLREANVSKRDLALECSVAGRNRRATDDQ
jgi:hypothetical protein